MVDQEKTPEKNPEPTVLQLCSHMAVDIHQACEAIKYACKAQVDMIEKMVKTQEEQIANQAGKTGETKPWEDQRY